MTEGYQALRESAAFLDLSRRAKIILTGEDRVRLLHALTTNDVKSLKSGEGCYAFFLNAQGRIQADVNVLVFDQHILLDLEPEARERVYHHLDHYIIADDVTLDDATDHMAAIGVEGPRAHEELTRLGAPVPEEEYAHAAWGNRVVARLNWTGSPGFRVFLPAGERLELVDQLEIPAAGPEEARTVRLENGKPLYGYDFNDATLPQETQLEVALSFTKGCYLGQEIVERIRSRGHVNRLLVRLEMDSGEAPCPPPKLMADGAEVGTPTSLIYSPGLGKVVGLGYARAQAVKPGAEFQLEGVSGTVRVTGPART
jgi:folate-binding protein YgfZ